MTCKKLSKERTVLDFEGTGSGVLLRKARSTLDLVGTGRCSQKQAFAILDRMRGKMSANG